MTCPKCGLPMVYVSVEFLASGYSCCNCRTFVPAREVPK